MNFDELNFDQYRVKFKCGEASGETYSGMGGCLERKLPLGTVAPLWGTSEAVPLIARPNWKSQDPIRQYEYVDIDQNGYPACCLAALCHATCLLLSFLGRKKVELDWLGAWRKLSGGRRGVALDTALNYAMKEGIALADGSGRVVVTEAWDAANADAYGSGLQRGTVGVFGHDAHAECAASLVKESGTWYLDTRNSWAERQRWHLFRLDRVEFRSYGGFLIREVELRPADIQNLPDAKGGAS